MKRFKKIELGQTVFFFFLLLLLIIFLFGLPRLSVPFGLAYLLYLVIRPVVELMARWSMPRTLSIFFVLLGLTTFIVVPVVKIIPMTKSEVENFQYYIPKIEDYLKSNYSWLTEKVYKRIGIELDDQVLKNALSYITTNSRQLIISVPKYLASVAEWIFVIPFLLFFFLRDDRKFKFALLRMTPNYLFERIYQLFSQFNKNLGEYVFAKFIEASFLGLIIWLGLLFLNVRFSLLLGIFAGITNIVPYLGPFLGVIPGIILGLVEYGPSSTQFIWIIGLYLVANAIDISIIFPVLVSKMVNLHPIIVVVSVILGSHFMGVMGMIVSIPVAAALKLIFSQIYNDLYPTKML